MDATTRRFLHEDQQGSIIAVSDAAGSNIAINTYDEYGVPGSGNIGTFQYTGQAYLPDLGMYYYKARIYASRLGRFLQTDPIGYMDQMNLYAYVVNDPIDGRDPSGETCANLGKGPIICKVDIVIGNLTPTQKAGLAKFTAQLTKVANRLANLPDKTIRIGPSGKAADGTPLGAFNITRKEALSNLMERKFTYIAGNNGTKGDELLETRGGYTPLTDKSNAVTSITETGLTNTPDYGFLHDGSLHGSREEYRGGLVSGPNGGSLMGSGAYRSGHQAPYNTGSCALLGMTGC